MANKNTEEQELLIETYTHGSCAELAQTIHLINPERYHIYALYSRAQQDKADHFYIVDTENNKIIDGYGIRNNTREANLAPWGNEIPSTAVMKGPYSSKEAYAVTWREKGDGLFQKRWEEKALKAIKVLNLI